MIPGEYRQPNKETTGDDFVRSYIFIASRRAKSRKEKLVLREARRLAQLQLSQMAFPEKVFLIRSLPRLGEAPPLALKYQDHMDQIIVRSWKASIMEQLRIALCGNSRRYAKEVKALKDNTGLLIAAVAGYIAASIGVAVAVIAALVAAILKLIMSIGTSAFCSALAPKATVSPFRKEPFHEVKFKAPHKKKKKPPDTSEK